MENVEQMGIEDSLELQTDYTSVPAQRITALLDGLESSDEQVDEALNMLREWDNDLSVESSAAPLFEIWYQNHLRSAVVQAIMSEEAAEHIGSGDPLATLDLLENPDERLGENPEEVRNQILLDTLSDAIDDVVEQLGSDMDAWRMG